ncbi:MAG TPA: LuxR C-terminal-related transcriptional regulator, partial [Micromonosporaceae bacterium]|nr:LuxR C-terminal-related transcriptional regulator [Micromonosporaceae bacterium]
LAAAVAAVRAAWRTPGWESGLAGAAQAAGGAGDPLTARCSAWLLVETLAADGRVTEAAQAARAAAVACAEDLAYSWQTRFLAAELWCLALHGQAIDDVVRRAGDLADRTLPPDAQAYAVAAASLAEADGGLLAPARARLAAAPPAPPDIAVLLDWVTREAAWLDGQPEHAVAAGPPAGRLRLLDGLRRITARWAAYDAGFPAPSSAAPGEDAAVGEDATAGEPLAAVRDTLAAWAAAAGDPDRFGAAAAGWHDLAVREEIRCLLAHGLHETDPAQAVPPLLIAERLAEQAGLVVLLGRAHRALRRHGVRRDVRGPRAGTQLTDRERDVLRLVAQGEPTRRIAGQLGISSETVETHIRSGMRKLGARTRTEAAARALEVLGG